MKILAIDPGLARCGAVLYDGREHELIMTAVVSAHTALGIASGWNPRTVERGVPRWNSAGACVIEHVGHYGTGQPAGKDVLDTCVLIGELRRSWSAWKPELKPAHLLLRPDVKTYVCHKRNATDAMVSQAVRDRFPVTGGGARPQVGTKKQPGPLYGVKGDAWQALALAITYAETVLGLPRLAVEVAQ